MSEPNHTKHVLHYTTGPNHHVRYEFNSEADMLEWDALVGEIKAWSRAISEHGEEGHARVLQYRRWLQFVDQFRQRFGEERVPDDIQYAYGTVVDNIGM